MVEWGLDGYYLYHPGRKVEFFIPYQIVEMRVSQDDIEGYWRLILHNTFCLDPPTLGKETREDDLLKYVFSVVGAWIHLYQRNENNPEGRAKYCFCRIIRSIHPRE